MKKLQLKLIFKSDYHISSSKMIGREIDSAIQCDENGMLIIPASTLKGIIRSKAYSLSKGNKEIESLFERVFGTQQTQGCCYIQDGKLEERKKPNINIKRGNSINREKRCAAKDMLYGIQVGGKELTFNFEIKVDLDEDVIEAIALIVVAAKMVKEIGAKVNRGLGECYIKLTDKELEENLIKLFEYKYFQKDNKWIQYKEKCADFIKEEQEQTQIKAGQYIMVARVESPLLVSNHLEKGNYFVTERYITGTSVLGAMHNKVASKEVFYKLLQEEKLAMGNLYPLDINKKSRKIKLIPSCMCPLSYCITTENQPIDLIESKQENEIYKKMNGFVKFNEDEELENIDATTKVELDYHLMMREEERRNKDGQVYAYEVIQSGFFMGNIDVHEPIKIKGFIYDNKEQKYKGELFIGKGISRGYGKCYIELISRQNERCSIETSEQECQEVLNTIYFFSDTIIKDNWGRSIVSPDALINEICGIQCKHEAAFIKTKNIKSFNGPAGLPRTQEVAIQAGSVISFRAKKLANTRKRIGYRKQEGFGEVIINYKEYFKNQAKNSQETNRTIEEIKNKDRVYASSWEEEIRGIVKGINESEARELVHYVYTYFREKKENIIECNNRENKLGGIGEKLIEIIVKIIKEEDAGKSNVLIQKIFNDVAGIVYSSIEEGQDSE